MKIRQQKKRKKRKKKKLKKRKKSAGKRVIHEEIEDEMSRSSKTATQVPRWGKRKTGSKVIELLFFNNQKS